MYGSVLLANPHTQSGATRQLHEPLLCCYQVWLGTPIGGLPLDLVIYWNSNIIILLTV